MGELEVGRELVEVLRNNEVKSTTRRGHVSDLKDLHVVPQDV